ncbi:hypothetical protein L798_12921 [Zootermopsis nevadensis]|uniref:Uncharacterized protein n=1 Tax=Zootermopsis nevadensis TaxID=136037 RepID=A0A067QT64_ZOONE|nr:hypothetical protein L798_12921 [Zootermopsis nevadensis]
MYRLVTPDSKLKQKLQWCIYIKIKNISIRPPQNFRETRGYIRVHSTANIRRTHSCGIHGATCAVSYCFLQTFLFCPRDILLAMVVDTSNYSTAPINPCHFLLRGFLNEKLFLH